MPVEAVSTEASSQAGLDTFFSDAMTALQGQEEKLRGSLVDAIGKANPYREVPESLKTMIADLKLQAKTPQDIQQVEMLHRRIKDHFHVSGDFFEGRIHSKIKNRQLEVAFTGVNNAIRGFQQLLSAN